MTAAREQIAAAFFGRFTGLPTVRSYRARSAREAIGQPATQPAASVFLGGHERAPRQSVGRDRWNMNIDVDVAVTGADGADAEQKLNALHASIVELFPAGDTLGGRVSMIEEVGMDEPAHEDGDIVTATIRFIVQFQTAEGRPSELIPV